MAGPWAFVDGVGDTHRREGTLASTDCCALACSFPVNVRPAERACPMGSLDQRDRLPVMLQPAPSPLRDTGAAERQRQATGEKS